MENGKLQYNFTKTFCILLLIPETGMVYRIYVKDNQGENKKVKDKKVKDKKLENREKDTENENENEKVEQENIKITILEDESLREDECKEQTRLLHIKRLISCDKFKSKTRNFPTFSQKLYIPNKFTKSLKFTCYIINFKNSFHKLPDENIFFCC